MTFDPAFLPGMKIKIVRIKSTVFIDMYQQSITLPRETNGGVIYFDSDLVDVLRRSLRDDRSGLDGGDFGIILSSSSISINENVDLRFELRSSSSVDTQRGGCCKSSILVSVNSDISSPDAPLY